ncbi:MAG TPA: DNA repair protein RadC [Alphaproteobacteria bacterium]|jgi:DNA repair protein RadC|nr:DNA repair protein RadC [Alphaproteobacteria bacterium]HJM51325.1 DNA repair protein RadC [Alphaproteobacteria bacterium]|tara:strand:+ start:98 stop:781 length:684 start_codon:yes stop_codon:yes gene_type:complete
MADKKPHYLGHRDRLRKRLASDAGGLADYELLELVLFLAKPRGDVKPLAKDLLAHFNKDFAEVMNADPARLEEVSGVGESTIAALKTVRAAALRLGQAQVLNRPALSSWQALLEYCRSSMAYSRTERFRILFLDRKNFLIADEEQQKGTVDHTPVYPREVVKRALELEASAIIMVHNHPSGDPTPSKADIAMTREVAAAGEKLGISLHDHVVIGKKGEASFKALGLL